MQSMALVDDPFITSASGGAASVATPERRWLSACYAAYFAFLGVATPYFSLWLAWRGLSPWWIAAISSAVLVSGTIGQASVGYCAMLLGQKYMMLVAVIVSLLATAGLMLLASPLLLLALASLAGLFAASIIPLSDVMTLRLARRAPERRT